MKRSADSYLMPIAMIACVLWAIVSFIAMVSNAVAS